MTEETWKQTKYEHYEVSNLGRVRRTGTGKYGHILKEPDVHKTIISKNGYVRAMMLDGNKLHNMSVARLVYEAFIGEIPKGMKVSYKDSDSTNCRPHNLFLATRDEIGQIQRQKNYAKFGSHSTIGRQIVSQEYQRAKQERALKVYKLVTEQKMSYRAAGKVVGLSESGVCRIIKGKNNKVLEKALAEVTQ